MRKAIERALANIQVADEDQADLYGETAVDLFSVVASVLGFAREGARHASDRKVEIARLQAEAYLHAEQALDLASDGFTVITTLCSVKYSQGDPVRAVFEDAARLLLTQSRDAVASVDHVRARFENAGPFTDWDKALQETYKWHGTAMRLVPYVRAEVSRITALLNSEAPKALY